jgi:hypothetical protein
VATSIVVLALAALAELFIVSTRTNANARATTIATLLALQKMEQLRALTWGFDNVGLPQSDRATDTTTIPESAIGGTGLAPSPPDTLRVNTAGYVDYLDGSGAPLDARALTPSSAAVFTRRWSIEPLPAKPDNTLVLQVLVIRSENRGVGGPISGSRRLPGEARLVSVKTRKAT